MVQGQVQGVGFRYSTGQRAKSAGVAGWVRNCRDGSVEAVFEGDDEDVARMVEWMRSGPRGAVVEGTEVSEEEAEEGLSGFEAR